MPPKKPPPKREPPDDISNFFSRLKIEPDDSTTNAAAASAITAAAESSTAGASAATSIDAKPADSKAVSELRDVSVELAAKTLERLRDGYHDKSGSSYPAAITTQQGCVLAQKGANRADNGYVGIAPLSSGTRAGTRNGTRAVKPVAQGAHRLAVMAWGSEEEKSDMLNKGWHASHICHNPRCFAQGHIVVEPKASNEKRKRCAQEFWVVRLEIDGEPRAVKSRYTCKCVPACLPQEREGDLME